MNAFNRPSHGIVLDFHHIKAGWCSSALWARITKNPDCSTGPLTRPFARLLAPLIHLHALYCSLRLCAPLHSLIRLLAHSTHSLARGTVNDWMEIFSMIFSVLDHRAMMVMVLHHRLTRHSSIAETTNNPTGRSTRYGPEQEKTQQQQPSNDLLSHNFGSE